MVRAFFQSAVDAVDRVRRPRVMSRADLIEREKPEAPKVKLRFEPAALFFGGDRARKLYAGGPSAGRETALLPDPAKLMTPSHVAPARSGPVSPRFAELERALKEEMRALDSVETGNSAIIAQELGRALFDRAVAATTETMSRMTLWAMTLGAAAFAAGYFLKGGDPFSFGAVYFLAALGAALFISMAALAASASARRSFAKSETNLVSLVERTTLEFQAKLNPLRATMKNGELSEAIRSSSEARLATVAALRFFDRSPAIGLEGDGHQCEVLKESVRAAAADAGAGGLRAGALFLFGIVLAASAALFLARTNGAAGLGATIVSLLGAEAARPGIVFLPLALAALLSSPLLFGPTLAAMGAAANPQGLLNSEPSRRLADELRGKALAAAAEDPSALIARYADALDALEARSKGYGGAAHGSSYTGAPTPWRHGAEPPRFVGTAFAAIPKTFAADAPRPGLMEKLFGGTAPKRGS